MFVKKSDVIFSKKADGVTQRMLGYCSQLMAVEMTFQKGSIVLPHCHETHTQCIYIVRGKFELSCGESKMVVSAGDCCYANPGELHGTLCLEDNSVLLDIHTPMREDILAEGLAFNKDL